MPHAGAPHLRARNLYAAFIAYNPPIAVLLIFSAVAFAVLCRSENPFAEQSVLFGLQRPVVNGFGLFDFSVRPFEYRLRRGQPDLYGIEIIKIYHF